MRTLEEIKVIQALPVKEIAKYIRKDLKEKFWKDFKFSVRIDWWCYTSSIYIEIVEWIIEIENKKFNSNDFENYHWSIRWEKIYESQYTFKWRKLIKEVNKIRNLYNYDNSDVMTDYFDKNYYWEVWYRDYIKRK